MNLERLFRHRVMEEAGQDGGQSGGAAEGGEAGGGENWTEALPESVRSWDEVKNSDSPDKFWEQVTNMRGLIGQSIRIPGENADPEAVERFHEKLADVPGIATIPGQDATEEQVKAFYSKLGVPETADKYEVYVPSDEEVPSGVEMDDSLNEPFKEIAHKINLTPQQAKALSEWYTKGSLAKAQEQVEAKSEATTALKQEYGENYDARINLAKDVIEKFGNKYALEDLNSEIGNYPGLAMMLADIGLVTTEGGMLRQNGDGGEVGKSATEIQAEIDDLMTDPAYADAKHDKHDWAVGKVQKLYEQLEVMKNKSSQG